MSFYLFFDDVIDRVLSVPGFRRSCFSLFLIIGIDVTHFSFFNELLTEITVYKLFISQHSSEQVIYVVAFSHSGL